jgi:hypothetical protein
MKNNDAQHKRALSTEHRKFELLLC